MESTPAPAAPPQKPRQRPLFRTAQTIVGIALLLGTLFTAFPSRGLANGDFYSRLSMVLTPHSPNGVLLTPQPQLRVGIVAGHSGNDSGAVCYDGNGNVAAQRQFLSNRVAQVHVFRQRIPIRNVDPSLYQ